jgi:DNA-binding transcriptional MerR regulator
MKPTDTNPNLIKISELSRLSGVSAPTIKFYIGEGLLPQPALRTSRNMAYYDPRLAERIRAIKNLQQNHFLPLKMIGKMLEPAPSAQVREDVENVSHERLKHVAPGIRDGQAVARQMRHEETLPTEQSIATVLNDLDINEDELVFLQEAGLLDAFSEDGSETLIGGAQLDLLRVISETRSEGLGDLFPLEILPEYAEALRTLVRMELNLFRKRVLEGAEVPSDSLMNVAKDATRLSERLVVALRAKIIFSELETLMQPAKESDEKS